MLSRAFVTKHQIRRNFNNHEENSCRSMSTYEYEEFIIGFKQDVPLVFFEENNDPNHNHGKAISHPCEPRLTLKEVLRASAGVMGEIHLGMTEKIVLLKGEICALKRFRKMVLKKNEFGRRIEKFARISRDCKQLVPITAYLYSKRIKFAVCDYYPMDCLVDLLSGARDLGQTALEWKHPRDDEERRNVEFEFFVQGKERKQVFNALNIALKCIDNDLETRPKMKQIVIYLEDILRG
ncbi:unnamed protein product [Withania somnifera]